MKKIILGSIFILGTVSCVSKEHIAQTIRENPDIIYDAIKKDPAKFMNAVRTAAESAQRTAYEDQQKEMMNSVEKDFKNPRQVKVDAKRVLAGAENAPVTIIKYADFQCPACRMGYVSLEKIKDKYKGQVRIIHKNIPLESIHPMARLSAQVYESLLLTDKPKAVAFYKKAYNEQGKWKSADDVWAMVKSVGANKKTVEARIAKGDIDKSIEEDLKEHTEQGFEGTPAYVVNGVGMYGAQSEEDFSAVIERHLKKN
jgi:protein-disulfide isomerase